MALTQETRDFIEGSQGFSRREVIEAGKVLGYTITARDVQTVRLGATPEKHAQIRQGLSSEAQSLRDSWRKNAEAKGLDTKIRGNEQFQKFRSMMATQDKFIAQLEAGKITRKEYVKQRLDIYLDLGLIDQEEYDTYLEEL